MKNRWGKGEPVSLSDLLKITPVANEIVHVSEELGMSLSDMMWIIAQIIENNDDSELSENAKSFSHDLTEDEWDDTDIDNIEDDLEQAMYLVNVKINGMGRFPEVGFKAGVNDKEDLNYFFDMIMEMVDKLD